MIFLLAELGGFFLCAGVAGWFARRWWMRTRYQDVSEDYARMKAEVGSHGLERQVLSPMPEQLQVLTAQGAEAHSRIETLEARLRAQARGAREAQSRLRMRAEKQACLLDARTRLLEVAQQTSRQLQAKVQALQSAEYATSALKAQVSQLEETVQMAESARRASASKLSALQHVKTEHALGETRVVQAVRDPEAVPSLERRAETSVEASRKQVQALQRERDALHLQNTEFDRRLREQLMAMQRRQRHVAALEKEVEVLKQAAADVQRMSEEREAQNEARSALAKELEGVVQDRDARRSQVDGLLEKVHQLRVELGSVRPSAMPARVEALSPPREGVVVKSLCASGTGADDLKKIRGIGPVIEARLQAMGVFYYRQIAAWTAQDVAYVDQQLEAFQGRIVRDAWVLQATELLAHRGTESAAQVDVSPG